MNTDELSLAYAFYPFVLAAVAVEIAWHVLAGRAYPWREFATSAAFLVMRVPVKALRLAVLAPVAALAWQHRILTVPLDTWWGWALAFVAVELAYYWMHRAAHEVRWMWASHAVHHTPERIHLASAFRLGLTDLFSGGWLFFVPLYLAGLHPLAVAQMLAVNLFYQFWLHNEFVGRLGPLEWVLNTPSHHRVHHASNPEYLDRNYGGVLIVWDRLFGTFAGERTDLAIAYGLVHSAGSGNPLWIALHEWWRIARDVVAARGWKARFRQAFGRPGDSLGAWIGAEPRLPRPSLALRCLAVLLVVAGALSATAVLAGRAPSRDALRGACKSDYRKLCAGIKPGDGRIAQCFRDNADKLSAGCRETLKAAAEARDKRKPPD